MANRKKGDYSVLSEINTEEEWLNLLERKVSSIKTFKDVIMSIHNNMLLLMELVA